MANRLRLANVPVPLPKNEHQWQVFVRELATLIDRELISGIDDLIADLGDAEQTLVNHINNGDIHFTQGDIALHANQITTGILSFSRLPISGTQVNNWDEAYGWGNHAEAGYAFDGNLQNHINDSTIHFTQEEIEIGQDQVVDLESDLDKKLDHDFARHVSSEDPVPTGNEGDMIYYTRVFLDGGFKITEHRVRDALGEDTVMISFREEM